MVYKRVGPCEDHQWTSSHSSMNKMLLSTLSSLLLIVSGGYGVEKEEINKTLTHHITKTQPKTSQTNADETQESAGINFPKRVKRMPDLDSTESKSFGYVWNNGNGVSYLKMHFDGQQSGGSGTFKETQDIGHHYKAALEDINKSRFHETAKKGDINLEKLKHFSQDNSYANLGNSVMDTTKNSFIQPSRDELNTQAKMYGGINFQSSGIVYDQNQNYENLNLGFGQHGFYINEKNGRNNLSSSALDFEPSYENIIGTQTYIRQQLGSDAYGLNSQNKIEHPGYGISPFSSHAGIFNGENIIQNAFSGHNSVGADKTISSTYNVEGGSGHEIKLGSEANSEVNTHGLNEPENDSDEVRNNQGDNYVPKNYAAYSQNDIQRPKQTEATEQVVPYEKFQELEALLRTTPSTPTNRHFLPQYREGYIVRAQNEMARFGHFPFLGLNQYNRFKKHLVSENRGGISRKPQGKEVVDSRLIGPGIYDFLDRNRGSDLVPQGSSVQNIEKYNVKDVSNSGTSKHQFQKSIEGPQNFVSKREESKEAGLTRSQYPEKKNEVSTDAVGYSYSRVTLGQTHGVLAEDKPTWKGPRFDKQFPLKKKLLQHKLAVPSKVNHSGKVQSTDTESLQDTTTLVHSSIGNKSKETPEEQLLSTSNTGEDIQNDERRGRNVKLAPNLGYEGKNVASFKNNQESFDHLFAGSAIAQHSFGNGQESEHLQEESGDKEQPKYGHLEYHPYFLNNKPEVREVTKAIPVHRELRIPVPHPIRQPILIPVPIRVLEPYHIEIPYPVTVEKTVEVPVEKVITYPVEKPVPVKVYKKVGVPVPKPYPVKVPVYKVKYIHHTIKKHQ